MKKKATRHYAHVAHAMHHHRAKYLPKAFYHKGSLFPNIFWKSLFLLFLCSFMGYFLIHNLAPQTTVPTLVEDQKMLFSLEGTPEDWGVDSNALSTHGAASNEFDFLFQPATDDTTTSLSQTDPVEIDTTKDSVSNGVDSSSDVGAPVVSLSGSTSTGIVVTGSIDTSPSAVSCVSPWGEKIQHADFILAYEQRSDVNSLCNVQKRYCSNGKLTGKYTQKSCKEDLKYTYTKVTPIAENNPDYIDPFIQPNDPSLSGADFDNNGKIISTNKPIDTWSDSGKSVSTSTGPYVTQTTSNSSSCVSPWGEKVNLGKFVKAYKSSVGLIDMPCEVEIRLCTKAGLKGSFKQASCTYKNMTYSDYLLDKPEDVDQPNIIDMTNTAASKNSNTSNGIWNRLTKNF